MNTFSLTVSTPDGDIFSGMCCMLTLRGTEGELAVMANHTPFITAIKPGNMKIVLPDDTEKMIFADGGLLTVADNVVTVLTSSK